MKYAEKNYGILTKIRGIKDGRQKPQKKTEGIIMGVMVMALTRLGSLNGLEQLARLKFMRGLIGEEPASADTVGRVMGVLNNDEMREINRQIYKRMKRNKAIRPMIGNMFVLIIDGHETMASYRRHCSDCLERKVETKKGEETQYYHRNVCGMLRSKDFSIMLDVEEQRRGEDEVAAGTRLLRRIMEKYPRAFNVIIADGLYTRATFFELALSYKKEVITVLKDERRELLQDARGIFKGVAPSCIFKEKRKEIRCWDMEEFETWDSFRGKVRVVRTIEERKEKRRKEQKDETEISEWYWVSTLTKEKIETEEFVKLAHSRWSIENNGFNEFVTYWHADHTYKHNQNAMTGFWLIIMIAYNLFHAFIRLNVKRELRERHTKLYFMMMITAELFNMNIVETG